ncbi:hypothetical protein [Mycobacterium sp. DL99]|uniref:hypothetical protein n=1 Tax=Mycobacterium sp. DL99 TaxID=2528957 RepID=UPI0010814AE7|nr:hypothetical protein [Mycobacterium sp. DL99]
MSTSTVSASVHGRHARTGPSVVPNWPGLVVRDPGDYEGRHRVDDARVGSVIVARFHNAPARLVELTRPAVSA